MVLQDQEERSQFPSPTRTVINDKILALSSSANLIENCQFFATDIEMSGLASKVVELMISLHRPRFLAIDGYQKHEAICKTYFEI